jgi:hypothetical protein
MAAPETTKLQINFKLSDGTLINLYADNQQELTRTECESIFGKYSSRYNLFSF